MKHNNVIPNGHFKKHWQNYVKTWFNQPARKARRRNARQQKAIKIFPRPTAGPLRPVVLSQIDDTNLQYNQAAGIAKKLAPTIGIAVDHRRRNSSLEGFQKNVQRLKTFKAKLVVSQGVLARLRLVILHLRNWQQPPKSGVFLADYKLRLERTNARHVGVRAKRAAEAEKEEKK
ncbi:hypothetical protein SASPL_157849 [Salvia splendens]|uniref:Large subunit ribosomal protein L13e n=1 Tax=Salvia splendens TaxID=180675 RepID=A0A8X8YUU8_SALSN|nr:hypothetical protein SASPL_157849 [Salvia splendens]